MAEDAKKVDESAVEKGPDYESPAIEHVVTREGLEREVAYAGVPGPSNQAN